MALLDDVKGVFDRLAPRGWSALFQVHGLNISVPKPQLTDELARPLLAIDRNQPGFEEFALDGVRAIEPSLPGRSLLYHALACPDVMPAKPLAELSPEDFPTLAELDVVENYIYSVSRRTLASFDNPIVAVVAYQYRGQKLSPHRKHADVAFSRTGVARVGTAPSRYDTATRSFDPVPTKGPRGFAVLPARYAAFVAEYRPPSSADSVLRPVAGIDENVPFVFPVHKLFPGKECLWSEDGTPLSIHGLRYVERHVNEKLRRMHRSAPDNPGQIQPLSQFDINAAPFVRNSETSNDLVKLTKVGASILIVPVHNKIVRTATQKVAQQDELVRFKVPKARDSNRFWSSLALASTQSGRAAPEYANIRQEVTTANGGVVLRDLNQVPVQGTLADDQFDAKLGRGGYEAAHFIDGTCDGAVSVAVGSSLALPVLPAYSLVTAVDYFPLVEQVEIEEWVERQQNRELGLARPGRQFEQGGPKPLSDGRFEAKPFRNPNRLEATARIPNPQIPDPTNPSSGPGAFDPTEQANQTATAIVGSAPGPESLRHVPNPIRPTSWLPDSASDVFAPGWDISQHTIGTQSIYAAYGLGSPFPEDSKLCAALNSFWPAVAPDSARTFGLTPEGGSLTTAIPLLDSELGYHPNHPRVTAGEVATGRGWDGEFGPFIGGVDGTRVVDAADPNRSDHTRAAFDGQIGFSGLDRVSSNELIGRMEDLQFCRQLLRNQGLAGARWLVTVEKVDDWEGWNSAPMPRASSALKGRGYVYIFAEVDAGGAVPEGDPPLRRRFPLLRSVEIQLSAGKAFWRANQQAFKSVNR